MSLRLDSDEVVLPSANQKDASPTLWDSFMASGTENIKLSQQFDLASRGYCAAPTSASLWLLCLSANALTGSGNLLLASLSLPLSHCFNFYVSLFGYYSGNRSAHEIKLHKCILQAPSTFFL